MRLKFSFPAKMFFLLINILIFTVYIMADYSSAEQSAQINKFERSDKEAKNPQSAKKDEAYYLNKVIGNEIEILKYKLNEKEESHQAALSEQKKEYQRQLDKSNATISNLKKELQKSAESIWGREEKTKELTQALIKSNKQIDGLIGRTRELEKKIDKQETEYEQAMVRKYKEHQDKIKQITEELEREYEKKLREKYSQLDNALREKNLTYSAQTRKGEEEFKSLEENKDKKEKMLRQLMAKKEMEFNQKLEVEKHKLGKEIKSLRKASKQLRIYLGKVKENLNVKELIIKEKDSQIVVLNKKIALLSEDALIDEKRALALMQEELNIIKSENARLKKERQQDQLKIAQLKNEHEEKIAQQESLVLNTKKKFNIKLEKGSSQWDKKLRVMEGKYQRQIKDLERKREKETEQLKAQLTDISEKLRLELKENEELKIELAAFRGNQVYLMGILASKASRIREPKQLIATFPIFDGKKENEVSSLEKEQAKLHFDRAMDAIVQKKYAKAKYEIKRVLSIEPDSRMALNILDNLNFLLGKRSNLTKGK